MSIFSIFQPPFNDQPLDRNRRRGRAYFARQEVRGSRVLADFAESAQHVLGGIEILIMSLLVLGTRVHTPPAAENYYDCAFIAKELGETLLVFAARKVHDVLAILIPL
jgi:hypothetical protein